VTVDIAVNPVNDAPVAVANRYQLNQGQTLSIDAAMGVLSNDLDVEGDALSAVIETSPAHAATFLLNADGSFSYTPQLGFSGVDSFTYRACDGPASSAVTTVRVDVRAAGVPVAWGENRLGQCNVPGTLVEAVQLAGGNYHALALKGDGMVVGWGYDGDGVATPPAGLVDVVHIAAGEQHSLAPKSDGTVVAWGIDGRGVHRCRRAA